MEQLQKCQFQKLSNFKNNTLKSTQMPLKSLIEMNTPSLNGSIIIQSMIEASTRGMHFPWDTIDLVKKKTVVPYF